jgi:membrane fusion protein, copper/silver efflux system
VRNERRVGDIMKRFWYAFFLLMVAASPFLGGGPLYCGEKIEQDLSSLPPGSVQISPERQQLIGIKTGLAEKNGMTHTIRVLGRVSADETRIYRIIASVDGWIKDARSNSVGSLVKKGEVLATFYNPQFLDAEQSYLFALGTVDRLELGRKQLELGRKEAPVPPAFDPYTVQRQIDVLRSMGVADPQIEEIGRTRKISLDIRIVSPTEGFVIVRNVSPGQRFLKGTELYQIVDLSHVWILADVFEREARYFKPGQKANVTLPYQDMTYQATVSEVLPVFDPNTRTLKVRLETDNPGFLLRPDMFADAELPVSLPPAVTVPVDAVLHSGLRKSVFVARGNGFFERRQVQTGWRMGDRIEITHGLEPGERIVISGNFLIDSESRLQSAGQGIYGPMSVDPVCGMEVDEARAKAAGKTSMYQGKTYYFCAEECKERFDKEPGKYVKK